MLRSQINICSFLVLLVIPVYTAEHNSLKSNGGNWISLDLRGLFIGSYLVLVAVHIAISTLAVIYSRHFTLLKIHLYAVIISLASRGVGLLIFGQISKNNGAKKYDAKMEQRKSFYNNIRIIPCWFVPTVQNLMMAPAFMKPYRRLSIKYLTFPVLIFLQHAFGIRPFLAATKTKLPKISIPFWQSCIMAQFRYQSGWSLKRRSKLLYLTRQPCPAGPLLFPGDHFQRGIFRYLRETTDHCILFKF